MNQSNDILYMMTSSFPQCPICRSTANFSIVNEKPPSIACQICEAEWRLFLTPEKDEILLLQLKNSDKEKRTKSLRKLKKTLGFWQNCDVIAYSSSIEKTIKKRLQSYGEINFRKLNEKAHQELLGYGDYTLYNAIGLLAGTYPVLYKPIFITSSRKLIEEFSDPRTLPDLQRIFSATLVDQHREMIFYSIVNIASKNRLHAEMIPFYKNAASIDKSANVRNHALISLMKCMGKPGIEDLVPFLSERILQEKDVDVRANCLFSLASLKDDPRIVNLYIANLHDDSIPNLKFDFPTSWEEVAITAMEFFSKLTIGEMAANTLIEIGDKKGILAVVDNYIENGFNPLHLSKKHANRLVGRYPYIRDHLINIKNRGDAKKSKTAAGMLTFLND